MADDTGVSIRLLGGFEATVDGRAVAADAWRLRKAKTLVKLLVLADGHRMHRESLVALLWPDRDTASGTNNLHQALYVARRVLATDTGVLFALREDVVLLSDSAMPWLDVEAFAAAGRRARQTRDPGDYRRAIELYRGDLLPEDQFEIWAEAPREALRERHLGLLVEFAEVLAERGEHGEVVDMVAAVTAVDPFHEGACRTLMTALAASGRRYEALAAFDRLREALTREYAADPEPATQRVYRHLLTGADAPADPPPVPSIARVTDSVRCRPDRACHTAAERGQRDPRTDVLRRSRPRDRRGCSRARADSPADPDRAWRRGQDPARLRGRGAGWPTTTPTGCTSSSWRRCRARSWCRTRWPRRSTCRCRRPGHPSGRWPGSWRIGACCWSWTTVSTCWTPAPGWSPNCCVAVRMWSCWPPAGSRCGSAVR